MALAALVAYFLYLAVAVGLRAAIQRRRTGRTGLAHVGGRVGSPEWNAAALDGVALLAGVAAPVLALVDAVPPLRRLDTTPVHVAAVALFAAGLAATLAAQLHMGASWRIGLDPHERTELVTTGPFALVRNPIYAATVPTVLGLVLMVPSVVALAGFLAMLMALEVQVRLVEEPHLRAVHGAQYDAYAARAGRFVPGVGRRRERRPRGGG